MVKNSTDKWAVLIGIDGYHESLGELSYCVNDARLMQETLVSECCGFPLGNIVFLADDQPKDRQPTFGNIHSWLGTWLSRPGPDDLVLVYFAGHGRDCGGSGCLAPLDATLDSLPVTGIAIQYVRDMLERCKAARKVFILDACHSGSGRDVCTMTQPFRTELDSGKGIYTIASCDSDQVSYDWPEKQHGVFTYYLTEAVRQSALPDTDGNVTLDSIYDWTRQKVLDYSSNKRLRQEPVRICRVKGQISIAGRPLSLEQRLAQARSAILAQRATIARLKEEVKNLQAERDALKSKTMAPTRPKVRKSISRAIVPEWNKWVSGDGPFDGEFLFPLVIAAVVAAIAAGALSSGILPQECPSLSRAALWIIGGLASLGSFVVAFSVWFIRYLMWRNRYRQDCSKICLKAGDYLQGSSFALAMGRLGVDEAAGAAVIVGLAELALENEDIDIARTLCERAKRRWKSVHAEQALKSLR